MSVISSKDTLHFSHNADGTVNRFEYSGSDKIDEQFFTKYILTSYAVGGGMSEKFAKKIFDTYFTPPTNLTPTLSTTPASNITQTTAISGGKITYDGGVTVTARGVCWSTTKNPTIENSKTSDGTGTGEYASKITNLIANTTYYIRAYATNANGTAYGNEISFVTQKNIDLPLKLSTSSLSLNVNATDNVEVTSGNGNYTAISNNTNIATVTISGNIITVKGIAQGNATITITDAQTKEVATIAVTVNKADAPPPTDRPKMAIEYFAEYNVNKDGTGFTSSHDNDESGYFNWYESTGTYNVTYNPSKRNIFASGGLKGYHLPSQNEWRGLFPDYILWYTLINNDVIDALENIRVNNVVNSYLADYRMSENKILYAIKFKSNDNRDIR